MLSSTVRRENDVSMLLVPHKFPLRGNRFYASKTKYGPHKWVSTEEELMRLLNSGYSIRMSPKNETTHRGPSSIPRDRSRVCSLAKLTLAGHDN